MEGRLTGLSEPLCPPNTPGRRWPLGLAARDWRLPSLLSHRRDRVVSDGWQHLIGRKHGTREAVAVEVDRLRSCDDQSRIHEVLHQHSIPLRSVTSGRRTTTAGRASRRGRGDEHRGGREQDCGGDGGCRSARVHGDLPLSFGRRGRRRGQRTRAGTGTRLGRPWSRGQGARPLGVQARTAAADTVGPRFPGLDASRHHPEACPLRRRGARHARRSRRSRLAREVTGCFLGVVLSPACWHCACRGRCAPYGKPQPMLPRLHRLCHGPRRAAKL